MKVLWITSVYPSTEQPGNGVFHETQVQALKRLGMEVTVICPVPSNPSVFRVLRKKYRRNAGTPAVYQRKGITVYRPAYTAFPGQLRWAQPDKRIAETVMKTIVENSLEADLIHAHFAMPSGGAARLIADQIKIPWVLTLHGSDVNVYPHYSKSARKAFIHTVQAADRVLAVGDSLKRKTMQMTGRDSGVLPIGIDLSEFRQPEQTKSQIRTHLNLPHEKNIILYVGRLTKAKGVFELAHALDVLPKENVIVFVGDGPAKEKLRSHPEFNRRLFLAGQVENQLVKDYLFASDIFALPSYTEGMPTVVIEALALKVPVVCTAVGGVPELFGKHRNLLIKPRSVPGLVERIQDFMYGRVDTAGIQKELHSHIQERYHSQNNARLLLEEYKRTLKSVH
ncbi:teichuronic acid biosynthesis protein TuaC [Peribacillus glennii]|uniref:Glycosyltransferase family 4 protein n=1 Tax=Peribacillus glennii TaxID=2303991 RepID=A0A372LDA9_9BACI|nr:glycosyltransferase [Peribacillus glennii]RFU63989.1 glycosyltransferase family 4 protein [Peribacillus glennii]